MSRRPKIAPRPRTIKEDALILNNDTFNDYCQRFYKVATSIFEWENLPDSMDGQYLEHCLYFKGMAGLLKTKEYGFINTKATASGDFNIYGLPTALNCYSYSFNEVRRVYSGLIQDADGNNLNDDLTECILVMNTRMRVPTYASMRLFALRLTEVERTIDTNIKRNKHPYILKGSKEQELTIRNMFNDIDNNVPAIAIDKNGLDLKDIDSIDLKVPLLANDLMLYKKEIMNEALTVLGINNLSEKRERLISDETNTNNELINLNLMSYLAPRQLACEQFNQKYGLTGDKAISVKIRSDLDNIIKRAMSVITDKYADQVIEDETKQDLGIKDTEVQE